MNFKELTKSIMDYDSDTFFAKGEKLTKKEAEKIAEHLIDWVWNSEVDGCLLSGILHENVRGDTDE